MSTRIIVTVEKDSTGYYIASTDEEWAASALYILTERWNEGYWYQAPDDDGLGTSEWADQRREEYRQALALTQEQIDALPESARLEVLGLRSRARKDSERDRAQRNWYERAKRVVEEQDASMVTVGRGRYERQVPAAWQLLDERGDHEYEYVKLIDLGDKGRTYT